MRKNISQIPWPERMVEKASAWGRQVKEIIAKNAIQFRNRHGGKFDWDNDDLSELEFTTKLTKMIHPDMVENLAGIELESNFLKPAVLVLGEKPNIMTQLGAARLNASLDNHPSGLDISLRIIVQTSI